MGKVQMSFIENWKKIASSVILFTTGTLLIIFWPCVWNHVLMKQLQLRPGTVIYNFWKEPPQPLYLDVYFFNWTNPNEFLNKSIKPNFVEIGPYRFQEFPQKVNVSFHDANYTVSYRKQSRYVFLPNESRGRLDDLITSVNVVALSAANQARSWNIFKVKGVEISLAFFDQQIHLTKTADELLFKGYDDPIITVAKDIASIMGIDVPFNRFGWFYMRNESSLLTGAFNANTGEDDIAKMGRLRTWNYESKASFFSGSCGNLENASAGELFAPGIAKHDQIISVFSPEMCRNIDMEFDSSVKVEGLNANKYIGGDRTIDNGTKYAKNECYCNGECVPSGVINVTACRLGAPVFMSFPHFFNADPYFRNQINGMTPNQEKHQFSMTMEPKTSLPLEIKGRFQLNVLMNPIKNINMYRDVPRTFMPIVWFEQNFKVNENLALMIKIALNIGLIGQIFGFIMAFTSLIGIYTLTIKNRKLENGSQIIKLENTSTIKTTRLPENSPLMS